MSSPRIRQAFILGAGLGTRLRPLTDCRPKPLVPILNKPLITFAFDHLKQAGITRLAVNTHHLPESYERILGAARQELDYFGSRVHFCHEPVLLETGGGIANVRPLLDDTAPFLVYNGDVLCDAPLGRLIERHLAEGNAATLLLRSSGGPLQVQCDPQTGRIEDVRQMLGGSTAPGFLFSGIYVLDPRIFRWIPAGEILSIIPVFLKMIQSGEKIGGVVEDGGRWFDLGNPESYVRTCRTMADPENAPAYPLHWPMRAIHLEADIAADARFEGICSVGARSRIGPDTRLTDTFVWDRATLADHSRFRGCIVRDGRQAGGNQEDCIP
ncbi:MAG TPA: sugar phosphate nucleotidyltransferase [Chthoniobacterales bacterium]